MSQGYKRILLASEISEHSTHTAASARRVANQNQAELDIIHVVEPVDAYVTTFYSVTELQEHVVEEARRKLDEIATSIDISDAHRFLEVGPPRKKIVEKANEINADLIITGSHEKHWLSPLIGSTAHYILSKATCDVLIVNLRDVIP